MSGSILRKTCERGSHVTSQIAKRAIKGPFELSHSEMLAGICSVACWFVQVLYLMLLRMSFYSLLISSPYTRGLPENTQNLPVYLPFFQFVEQHLDLRSIIVQVYPEGSRQHRNITLSSKTSKISAECPHYSHLSCRAYRSRSSLPVLCNVEPCVLLRRCMNAGNGMVRGENVHSASSFSYIGKDVVVWLLACHQSEVLCLRHTHALTIELEHALDMATSPSGECTKLRKHPDI